MTKATGGAVFWAPRILTILFALFLSLFALDVFAEAHGDLETLAALVLHLVPAFLVVILLVLAWRWDLVGVIAFAGLAVTCPIVMRGRGFPWVTYVTMSVPLLLMSVLFLLSWRQRRRVRTAGQQPPEAA